MSDRLLLIDSDVFVALSGSGLLHWAIDLIGFDAANVRRLPALKHQLIRGAPFKRNYPEEVRESALDACNSFQELAIRPEDDSVFQALVSVDQIDYGEALLFGLLWESKHSVLATGDKRALRALGTEPTLKKVRRRLAGRVCCLETILLVLIERYGMREVAQRITPVRDCSKVLRVVFSQGESTPQRTCVEGLEKYVKDLRKDVGANFLWGA